MATLLKPINEAETARFLLPREAYFSGDWYRREMETLFAANWYFAGFTRDVPESGDYSCVQVGAYPMFFLRDQNGDLRAFHNLCRHRGTAFLSGKGNVRHGMTCFYHFWTYNLDGGLRGFPQREQFPGADRDRLGLRPGAVETFRGMVFVHVDPDAQGSLIEWMSDFPANFGPFDPEKYVESPREPLKVAANWKLFIENHIDGYHLFHLHKDSIHGLDHDNQEHSLYADHWTVHEPLFGPTLLPEYEKNMPVKVMFPDEPRWQASNVHMLFPNLGIATGAKWFVTVQSIPTGPTTSIVDSRMHYLPYEDGEEEQELTYYDKGSSEGTNLMAEDQLAAERLQVAMQSPLFECGPLARNYERPVMAFHESILRTLKP